MLLRQLCMYGTSGEKRVVHRDEQVLDHVIWPQHGMTAIWSAWPWRTYSFIHSVESTLEYCNGFGPVCFNSSSPSFEGCTSGSHVITSASIVQRSRTPLTAMGMWSPSLACWVAKCSVFGRVPLQRVLLCWQHTCSTLRWWTNMRACILQRHRGPTLSVMIWGTIWDLPSYVLRSIWTVTATLGTFTARGTAPHSGNSTCHIPAEHVWDMVGRRLIRQSPPAPTPDALWSRIQTEWRDIPHEGIQGLFDSMPRRILTLIAAHGGFTPYWNHMLTDHVQLCNSNGLSIAMYLICGIHFICHMSPSCCCNFHKQ